LPLSTFAIAEKFVEYYWRQATPYAAPKVSRALRQNTGQPAKVISLVEEARRQHGDSLASIMRNGRAWKRLVRQVERVVTVMPLWKLQTVGKEKLDFLYGDSDQDEIYWARRWICASSCSGQNGMRSEYSGRC
jgi:hypothetical protein